MAFTPITEADLSKVFPDHSPAKIELSAPLAPLRSYAVRTSKGEAQALVRVLLSGYPSLKDLHDPEGYMANIASILCGYVKADAQEGIQTVANHGGEFAPSRFTVRKACDEALSRRVQIERLRALPAAAPLAHHPRGVDPAPNLETGRHPTGTVLQNFDDAFARYGRPVGAFEEGRLHPYATAH